MTRARRHVQAAPAVPARPTGQEPAFAPLLLLPPARELWGALHLPPDAPLTALAVQAQRFSPRVSLEPPVDLLLELRGSVKLFGGLPALYGQLQRQFPQPAALALAPTPLAALALARAGKAGCLNDEARLVSRLAPLPLAVLGWPPAALQRLFAMGVRTIGEALRLPRAGFAQRMGAELLLSLDRLVGRSPDPRVVFRAPECFRERCEPAFELTDTATVLQVIEPALQGLERFLSERQRGICLLALRLAHRSRPPTRCVLRLAQPEYRATQFARLLASHLQPLVLPAPVRYCELRSGALLESALASTGLWQPGEQGGGAAPQMPAFLERLRARLGPEAVRGLCLVPGHRPERQSRLAEPVLQSALRGRGTRALQLPEEAQRRPLWLLNEPQLLPVAGGERGYPLRHGRRLQLLAGPERLESGWWDGSDIQRDYYLAADAHAARLWIYRECSGQRRWFLHGYFG